MFLYTGVVMAVVVLLFAGAVERVAKDDQDEEPIEGEGGPTPEDFDEQDAEPVEGEVVRSSASTV